jgi:hypothetical protein
MKCSSVEEEIGDLREQLQKLESKMAIFDDLTTAVAAQATALTALEVAVKAIPTTAAIDTTPLTEAVTSLQANTAVIEAMIATLPHA